MLEESVKQGLISGDSIYTAFASLHTVQSRFATCEHCELLLRSILDLWMINHSECIAWRCWRGIITFSFFFQNFEFFLNTISVRQWLPGMDTWQWLDRSRNVFRKRNTGDRRSDIPTHIRNRLWYKWFPRSWLRRLGEAKCWQCFTDYELVRVAYMFITFLMTPPGIIPIKFVTCMELDEAHWTQDSVGRAFLYWLSPSSRRVGFLRLVNTNGAPKSLECAIWFALSQSSHDSHPQRGEEPPATGTIHGSGRTESDIHAQVWSVITIWSIPLI